MSASPHTEPFLEQAWGLVLARAGVNPERFDLLPVPGAAVAGYNQAAAYPPGETLVDNSEDLLRGELLREANSPEHRAKHRIAIYEDVDPEDAEAMAVLLGKLRHEVRHAEQRDACGQARSIWTSWLTSCARIRWAACPAARSCTTSSRWRPTPTRPAPNYYAPRACRTWC
jgi:hypothetical protein